MPQIIWGGQSGCLLPLLIIFNLLFGKAIFNSVTLWLGVEAALVFIFIIKMYIFMYKIRKHLNSAGFGSYTGGKDSCGKVVDVEGKVVEDNKGFN
ncbi:MAG: hypothetical protein WC416_00865 [Candidatus Omnitrophota bacterium]|jgi:hypothetical protein|nr:hypothetical protein [Candidatus Omnitrophota bacterium]